MKKWYVVVGIILIIGMGFCSYAMNQNINVLLNKQVQISYDGKVQRFQDTNGVRVYPITYNGTTYLPVRSISALFGEKIKWDWATNSVRIGEGIIDTTAAKADSLAFKEENENIQVLMNEDIKIYYQGQMQTFRNVNGEIVYPLSYEGTTYLPVRAISNLFGTEIEWNANNNTVSIGIKKAETKVSGVSINKTAINIEEGETNELVATVIPNNAINKKVLWTSSNTKVATVKEGRVTGIKAGTATITVTTIDGGKQATCKVTVTTKGVSEITKVESIKLNKESTTIVEGGSETLTVAITPSNATNKNVTWSSSNTSIATVSGGTVKGIKAGTAIITAKTVDGSKIASCTITVKKASDVTKISVTGVTLNKTSMSMKPGETAILTATITPTNATNKNVIWSSSNTSIATVSNGTIKGIKAGTAIITAKTVDGGKKASCIIIVKASEGTKISVTGVKLNKTSISLTVGKSETLTATITPTNATNKNVTWSSSNTSIATVSNGTIKGIRAGMAIVTVQTVDGNKKGNCIVTVKAAEPAKIAVTGVILNKTNMSLGVGKTATLTASVQPSNATNKNVTWSSSNSSVATVSNGTIKGIKAGMAIITVQTVDGNKKGNCIVTVKAAEPAKISVTGVTLNKTSMSLAVGKSGTVAATVAPSNATNKNITWSSSNTSIATVSNGTVKGIKEGTAIIMVKTADGSKIASCTVTVKESTPAGQKVQVPLRINGEVLRGADPWVIQKDGYYYFTCTSGTSISIGKTTKLQDIGKGRKAVYKSPKNYVIWAPELHYINGRWYIYYTDCPANAEGKYGTNRRLYCLRAKTDDALGEYEYMGKVCDTKHDYYTIDGTVLQWNGELYLLWSGWDSKTWRDWMYHRIYIAKLNKNQPWILDSDRVELTHSEKSWEKHDGNVTEGPEVLIKDGTLHIIYSASSAQSNNYCLGMLTYKGGNLLKKSSWSKSSSPVFQSGNGVYSPGHCSFTKSPDGTEDWIVYHAAYNKGDSKKWNRNIRIQKFTWNGTTPVFGKPVASDSYIDAPSE